MKQGLLIVISAPSGAGKTTLCNLLVKEFELDTEDFVLLYRILPESAKKYIIKEKLHEGLNIKADEIEILNKFVPKYAVKELKHEHVYMNLMSNWRNRRTRYSRIKSY